MTISLRMRAGIESLAAYIVEDALQRVAVGHAAVDKRQFFAAVDEIDVAIGIVGKPERVRHPTPHHVDLIRDPHFFTILLALIEAR